MKNSTIFIDLEDYSSKQSVRRLFSISLYELIFRICASFIPPLAKKFQKVYIDFIGPTIACIIFLFLLQYGHYNKKESIEFSPIKFFLMYAIVMPFLCKLLLNISHSGVSCYEIVSLVGYALYGHILTLSVSLILFDEASNKFFFVCLIFFSGPSTFRLAIILLKSIPKPVVRLLVCSVICVTHILSLIFVHFAYMHKTYTYGRQTLQN